MGKLTNRRYYLDYNSTSPLAGSVKRWLSKGDFDFMNPSSLHSLGKKASAAVCEVEAFLNKLFGINHHLFFHSGATEGNNTIIRGWLEKMGEDAHFFYGPLDHSSVRKLAVLFKGRAHQIEIDAQGNPDLEHLISDIQKLEGKAVLVNHTVVNNETGVHWPLKWAKQLKERTGCTIHVDASQLVAKVEKWNLLLPELDAYTFSGHKFGALKGSGFSFYRDQGFFTPLVLGGDQQRGMRSGTLNVMGIYSLMLALGDAPAQVTSCGRDHFEQQLVAFLGERGKILGRQAYFRSCNTLYLALFKVKTESLLAAFDLSGLEVSSGSACSSGISDGHELLNRLFVRYEGTFALIRFSFSPQFGKADADRVFKRTKKILSSFL